MYGKPTATGVLGAGALAFTGRPIWGLVLFGVIMILLGLLLVRAVCVRGQS